MKFERILSLAICMSAFSATAALAAPAGTRAVLNDIAANADVANGSTEVRTYKVAQFDRDAELKKLNRNRSRYVNCGPWKQTVYRREGIAVVKNIDQNGAAQKLSKLYEQNQLKAMITLQSNNEIECSLTFVEIYTGDGLNLELNYSQGD